MSDSPLGDLVIAVTAVLGCLGFVHVIAVILEAMP